MTRWRVRSREEREILQVARTGNKRYSSSFDAAYLIHSRVTSTDSSHACVLLSAPVARPLRKSCLALTLQISFVRGIFVALLVPKTAVEPEMSTLLGPGQYHSQIPMLATCKDVTRKLQERLVLFCDSTLGRKWGRGSWC